LCKRLHEIGENHPGNARKRMTFVIVDRQPCQVVQLVAVADIGRINPDLVTETGEEAGIEPAGPGPEA
jgi:hypothetical protein